MLNFYSRLQTFCVNLPSSKRQTTAKCKTAFNPNCNSVLIVNFFLCKQY